MPSNHAPDPIFARSPQNSHLDDDSDADWLVTYADIMALLLTFFVLMFSVMEVRQTKFEELNQTISETLLRKPVINPLIDLYDALSGVFDAHHLNPLDNLSLSENGLTIHLPEEVLFASASTDLDEDSKRLIHALATEIKNFHLDYYTIEIEGHTDDIPIRTARFPSNWELSSARAITVLQLFFAAGIDNHRLKAIGYGDSRPKIANRNDLGIALPDQQKQNRRVEIVISIEP
jgi:chemotaxis protein MotB